jgi:hypothetical protein
MNNKTHLCSTKKAVNLGFLIITGNDFSCNLQMEQTNHDRNSMKQSFIILVEPCGLGQKKIWTDREKICEVKKSSQSQYWGFGHKEG